MLEKLEDGEKNVRQKTLAKLAGALKRKEVRLTVRRLEYSTTDGEKREKIRQA